MVVRFGQPPTCEFCQYAWQAYYYDQVPWKPYSQVDFADLQTEAVYISTLGGSAAVVPGITFKNPLSEAEAGWVYIRRLPFTGDEIYAIQVNVQVKADIFTQWYDSYQYWDDNGDPFCAEGTVIHSTPPSPSCTSSSLGDCTTKGLCEGVGAYWYDSVCHAAPICDRKTLGTCTSEADCLSSSLYWYDDQCNAEARCRVDNPAGCETKSACETINKYWYDNACHGETACSAGSLERCTTAEQCTASDFYWYTDGSCHELPPCGADHLEACLADNDCLQAGGQWLDGLCQGRGCSTTNLGACEDSLSCAQKGGIWYYDLGTCNEPECGPYELFSCLNAVDCAQAGGAWDGHACRDAASSQTCSPANLAACPDALHCGLMNGFWNGKSCVSSSSGSSVEFTCDANHLDLCDNQNSCTAAGGEWDGRTCGENLGAGQMGGGGCDLFHRTTCTDEQSCDGARGFWYDNSCHTAPAPKVTPPPQKTQEVVDYNGRLGDAYVQLGSGALDEELNAGDQLELHLNFPSSTKSAQRYAGIMLDDQDLYFILNQGGDLLSLEVTPLQGNSFSSLDQSLLPVPWDVCAGLGDEYQGVWTVYFLTVDSSSSSHDLAGLQQSWADSSYYLGWYQVKVDCSKQAPPPVSAVPAQPMAARTQGVVPSATVVTAAAGPLLFQPTLTVVPEDVGKTASLFAYIFYPNGGGGFNFSGSSLTLAAEENFSSVFPDPIDFTGRSNTVLDLYFGYVLDDGTRKFNAYEIKIQ